MGRHSLLRERGVLTGTRQRIHEALMEQPGQSQRELANRVGVTPSVIDYHLHILTKYGHVQRQASADPDRPTYEPKPSFATSGPVAQEA